MEQFSPAAVASAVAGPMIEILSPELTATVLEMVKVPVVPEDAKATVPKDVPLSTKVKVVDPVAAVIKWHRLVAVTPLYVPDPPEGMTPATGE